MEKLSYRPVNANDYPVMASWYRDPRVMAPVGFPNGIIKTTDRIAATVARDMLRPGAGWDIILLDDQPIGEFIYSLKTPDTLTFDITIGDFDCQRKGFGTQVLREHLPAVARARGAKHVVIEVDAANEVALHVYAKVGFKESAEQATTWRDDNGQSHAAVVLVLDL
ncbi:GNAT family N-acetyltransferase [Lacticaseibacillus hegangensis]|uniref:GNAT family N-acetyltransferase n=1 Tax=Lacticaseibacillus hegangensis TaxID=2486010 RepID=A0ABW4CX94_9LACO|nr:GNAT family N-acetyltransferase [Lacticaseibacillus hegangensis]